MRFKEYEWWLERYLNHGCHPDFIQGEFNKVCGKGSFPVKPSVAGMLRLDEDFIQAYKMPDDTLWANVTVTDHSYDYELRNSIQVVVADQKHEKYSTHNWNHEFRIKHFPE